MQFLVSENVTEFRRRATMSVHSECRMLQRSVGDRSVENWPMDGSSESNSQVIDLDGNSSRVMQIPKFVFQAPESWVHHTSSSNKDDSHEDDSLPHLTIRNDLGGQTTTSHHLGNAHCNFSPEINAKGGSPLFT